MLGDSAVYTDLELSPDGKRASSSIIDQAGKGRGHLVLRRGAQPANALHFWSRNRINIRLVTRRQPNCFQLNRKGHLDLYQKSSSGAGTEEVLLEDNLTSFP